MTVDVWSLVHAERAALVQDLERLEDDGWEVASLCAGWSVHDVTAHLCDVARTTRARFLADVVAARFDFDRSNARGVRRHRGATPAATLARLRAGSTRTSTPPAPRDSRIVEEVLHGEDVRRPLGLVRAYPQEAVLRSLRYQLRTSTQLGGAKEVAAPLRLVAVDADLVVGDGAETRGTALDLLLAVSGRRVSLAGLTGPGVGVLGSA